MLNFIISQQYTFSLGLMMYPLNIPKISKTYGDINDVVWTKKVQMS